LLNTPEEKIALLAEQGIDNLVIVPFTQSFAQQPAGEYINRFLIGRLHPHTIIIGYDHRFGRDRKGDFRLLEQYAARQLFSLIEIPGKLIDAIAISSTRIRTALLNSNPQEAKRFLGYDYFFEGTVIEGNKLGRTLGYPTANIALNNPEKLVPGNGVYAVEIGLPASGNRQPVTGTVLQGMMNIGLRPTVDGARRMIEVNIFDFDEDIYGRTIRVSLKAWLRGEQKFNGLDALKEQLGKDRLQAIAALSASSS
jgi:riboflavin kinase/FMN adenylyltransferase